MDTHVTSQTLTSLHCLAVAFEVTVYHPTHQQYPVQSGRALLAARGYRWTPDDGRGTPDAGRGRRHGRTIVLRGQVRPHRRW